MQRRALQKLSGNWLRVADSSNNLSNNLSDLHVGFSGFDTPLNDADVVVLAGGIAPPRRTALSALRSKRPVVYVLGNHEFYGSSIEFAVAELKQLCAGTQVHVLDNDEVIIDGVRFLGSTLWTDFKLFGDGTERTAAIVEAQRLMRDFSHIRIDEETTALMPRSRLSATPPNSIAGSMCHMLGRRSLSRITRRRDAASTRDSRVRC